MERRGFLKGLLGAGAGAILAKKTISAEEAGLLNTGQLDVEDVVSNSANVSKAEMQKAYHTIVYKLTTEPTTYTASHTTGYQNYYYYYPGDEIIKLQAGGTVSPGDVVAVDKNYRAVPYKPMLPDSYPDHYPIGIVLKTVTDPNKGNIDCIVQVRTSAGWINP